MATFNPQYVNLNPYEAAQINRQARAVSPIDAALQSLQQGIQLQQLPQQLQDQALQRQLNNAILGQRLTDLQNPDAAFNRKLQQELIAKAALNPDAGIYQSPVNESIANPGAITEVQQATLPSPELLSMRQTALDQAGIPLPNVAIPRAPAAGLTETPITGLGGKPLNLMINPNIPIAAEDRKIEDQIRRDAARRPTSAARALTFRDVGNAVIGIDPLTGVEVSRIATDPKKERFNTAQGVFEVDPAIPGGGRILPGTEPAPKAATAKTMQGYDTKTGLYGLFSPDEDGTFAEGIVPASQAPRSASTKPLPITQSDQFTGLNLLDKRLDEIEKSPKSVRKSNVGWIDSALGYLQNVTGVGDSIGKNDAFRTAVDSLVGEFSFGRGGKALTVNEKEVLAKYLPSLIQSDDTFESRLSSFRNLVKELRESRIESLSNSGYDVSKFSKDQSSNTPQEFKTIAEAEKAKLPKGTKITVGGRPAEVE